MKYQRMLRNLLSYASASCEEDVIESNKLYEELLAYLNEHEALNRDIKAYMKLVEPKNNLTEHEGMLWITLFVKLSKVGKEE